MQVCMVICWETQQIAWVHLTFSSSSYLVPLKCKPKHIASRLLFLILQVEHFEKYWSHAKQKGFEVSLLNFIPYVVLFSPLL